jgi:hypothetical protein
VGSAAVGLLIEEHRVEIREAWLAAAEEELSGERALEFAVGPLLRELAAALRGDVLPLRAPRPEGLARCAVLVRSASTSPRLAREFKLLHRALWNTLRKAGRIVALEERRAADEWLDEALAASLERVDRIRMRIDLLDHPRASPPERATAEEKHMADGKPRQRPPPLPWERARRAPVIPPATLE